jgi:hypothetical protein
MLKYVYFVLVCLFAFTIVGIEFREGMFRNPDPAVLAQQHSKQLFESACSKCHGLAEVDKANHSAAAWKDVMRRMVNYSNGTITAEQSAIIYKHILEIKNLSE